MLDTVWPTINPQTRDELISQCVRNLKNDPENYEQFSTIVAAITKSRRETVKSQWRLGNYYGTKLALARDPDKASPALTMTFMAMRKDDVTALYEALGVAHKDLAVEESAITVTPPTEEKFAAVLKNGLTGISPEIVRCMVAVIADAGITEWQGAARGALSAHMKDFR